MFIDEKGNVGIGTNQPRAKLDVGGTLEASELEVSGTIKAKELYLGGTRNGVPVGTIVAYFGAVAPEGWLLCDGSTINKKQNPAYAFLVVHLRDETKVGSKAFRGPSEDEALLPDLRGRVPLGAGSGANLSARTLGESGGEETHKLTVGEMPKHSHNWLQGRDRDDQGWGKTYDWEYVKKPGNFPGLIAETGGDQPHNNMQPFLAVHYIIKY